MAAFNLILDSDSYKASHFLQYPPQTTAVSSYIESRGGKFNQVVFFGLQAFLRRYLCQKVESWMIDEAEEVLAAHGEPFHRAGWERILEQGGYLPLEIQALAEGTLAPTHTPLLQVVNTDPACFWLTSYIETALLRAIWYPTTVATTSWHCRQVIALHLDKSADDRSGLLFKLHDFGARGVSSEESAQLGGLSHLVNFRGTDTLSALLAARRYYDEPMAGFSIPAAEHATITSWGKAGERDAYANMLKQFSGPGKLLAVVSDSYDLWYAIEHLWGDLLLECVQKSGGTLVIRPDSGDPVQVVSETVERLMARFGYSLNTKGYKLLPTCVRVIQGDGINIGSIDAILTELERRGLSADNTGFGMGGALLQQLNRDTLKFAMKASAIQVGGEWRDCYKDPVTDPGKASKRGRLAVVRDEAGALRSIREEALGSRANLLLPVFRNGEILRSWSLAEIRQRANGD